MPINNGDQIYFHEPTQTFHITDFSICFPRIYPFENLWDSNDMHGSDNLPIFILDTTLDRILITILNTMCMLGPTVQLLQHF